MSVIVLLIIAGGLVAAGFLAAFAWAVGSGQYDDMASPPLRMLFDDAPADSAHSDSQGASHDIRR